MTDAVDTPRTTQLTKRQRRWALAGIAGVMVALFAAGMLWFILDGRHQVVCPNGAQWISRSDLPLEPVTYTCPGTLTVTQGLMP